MLHTKRRINCESEKGKDRECLLWLKIKDNTTNVENYDGEIADKAIIDLGCTVMPNYCRSKVLWSRA